MAKRDNHYEAAFEAWLRWLRVPYVAVDESHRAAAPTPRGDERSLKSLDFIVSPADWPGSWLVDVKGRQFPTAGCQYWRNREPIRVPGPTFVSASFSSLVSISVGPLL